MFTVWSIENKRIESLLVIARSCDEACKQFAWSAGCCEMGLMRILNFREVKR